MMVRVGALLALLALVALVSACSVDGGKQEEVEQVAQRLSGAQALMFESTSPWAPGGTTLALSSMRTQGNHSLRVTTPSNWHEIVANNLSSVGAAGPKLGLDVRIDRQHPWGVLRAIVKLPSQQEWYTDLGEVTLTGRPVNQFFRVEFNLPTSLSTKLAGSYNDLEVRFILSAPPAVYHIDNGSFAPPPSVVTSADVGTTGATGSATLSAGTYTIRGAGNDIEDSADSFHFLYKSLTGDGQIVARIVNVTETDPWTKVGVMVRDSLAPNSKNAFMLLRPSLGSAFQYRSGNGAATQSTWQEEPNEGSPEQLVRYLRPAQWLKLTRQGNVMKAYSSEDGSCWHFRWQQTLAFDDSQAFFGVALTSGNFGTLATATVTNFSAESTIEPNNAQCARAAIDGDLPTPTTWIAPPGRFGTSTWNYTTTNPNGAMAPVKCDPGEPDNLNEEPAKRTDGSDHPNCPDPEQSPAWTQIGFNHGTPGWQFNKPAGIGAWAPEPGDTLATTVSSRGIWLRKTFSLSSQAQKNDLVLWGRWSEGLTVYINGVLATRNSSRTHEYKYLGLSNEARAALNVGGSNVIAVRLEWEAYHNVGGQIVQADAWDRFFDLGLAREPRVASLPVNHLPEVNPAHAAYVDAFKEIMQEQGMSGASLAVRKNGQLLVSAGLGWFDKNLTTPMPRGAIMRLASNDKIITQAAIVKLIQANVITPSTPVFPLLNLQPVPDYLPGANVNDITVEHLRTHTSGIADTWHTQSEVEKWAFKLGVQPSQWNKHHKARWLFSLNATEVGGASRYSSNGYFLLRYLVEHLIAPQTIEEYMSQDMGLTDVVVSAERLADRQPNEPGYITREQPWDRWMALDDYLAFSASAEGYASFYDNFAQSYDLVNGSSYQPGGGGVAGGGMAGTWSIAITDRDRNFSLVMLSNNHGNFDDAVSRLNGITNSDPCLFGNVDPRTNPGNHHYIRNVWQDDRYINLESGLAASPAEAGWWSAQWIFEPVNATYFRIRSKWTGEYLHIEGGPLQIGPISTGWWRAQWRFVPVGDAFRIQNRGENQYLNVETGTLTSSTIQPAWLSAQWRFCD